MTELRAALRQPGARKPLQLLDPHAAGRCKLPIAIRRLVLHFVTTARTSTGPPVADQRPSVSATRWDGCWPARSKPAARSTTSRTVTTRPATSKRNATPQAWRSRPAKTLRPASQNAYAYVNNNPLAFIDPTGLFWIRSGDGSLAWTDDDCTKEDENCFSALAVGTNEGITVYGGAVA